VGFREATAWSVLYVGLAVGFGIWFTFAYGGDFGTGYFAGYLVEKSLSVDNLVVFVVMSRSLRCSASPRSRSSSSPPTPLPCSDCGLFFLVRGLLDRLVYLSLGLSALP
jgi:hypothetical protein